MTVAARLSDRGALVPALVGAAGLLAVLMAEQVLQGAGTIVMFGLGGGVDLVGHVLGVVRWFVLLGLPFSVGVFVSLWLLVPIASDLAWAQVVLRTLVATVLGAVLVVAVGLVGAALSAIGLTGSIFGASFPFSYSGSALKHDAQSAFHSGAMMTVGSAVHVVLLGVLMWLWSRRAQGEPRRPV